MMNKPIFCSLAFGSVSINTKGHYVPCCNNKDFPQRTSPTDVTTIQKLNSADLKSLRKVLISGEWPSVCVNCKKSEDIGVPSMRHLWNKALTDHSIPMAEEVKPEDVYSLDLSFGSKCNSKCMTCSPGCSNFWEEEWTHIWKILPDVAREKYGNPINLTVIDALLLVETYPNVRTISFIGGEPTILDEHFAFLEALVNAGMSKNIRLSYVTNLTGISEELISLWETFEHVACTVSIDGFGPINEYIRYPVKWSKVEENLRRYLKLTKLKFNVGLSLTMSIFNCLHIDEIIKFWCVLMKECGVDVHAINVNRAYYPLLANSSILSKEYKQLSIDKLLVLRDWIEADAIDTRQTILQHIDVLLDWIPQERRLQITESVRKSVNFLIDCDRFPNRHVNDYVPELWDFEILDQHGCEGLKSLRNHILSGIGTEQNSYLERIDLLISWLSEDNIHAARLRTDARMFIEASDKYRNRHIKDFIPELWAEL